MLTISFRSPLSHHSQRGEPGNTGDSVYYGGVANYLKGGPFWMPLCFGNDGLCRAACSPRIT